MTLVVVNLILALVWGAVTASFQPWNLLFGFVMGWLSLWLVRDRFSENDFYRPIRILSLVWLFLVELLLSGLKVARDTLLPWRRFEPAIVAIPLTVDREVEITLLANLITLTPGTLSVDVSSDRSTLYVHAMDVEDVEALRRDIKTGFERRILRALR